MCWKQKCCWDIVLGTLYLVLTSNLIATWVWCTWYIVLDTWFLAKYVLGMYQCRKCKYSSCTICIINSLTDGQIFVTELCFSWIHNLLHIPGTWSDYVQSIWCQSWPVECGDNCVPVSNRKSPISGLLVWKQFKKVEGSYQGRYHMLFARG